MAAMPMLALLLNVLWIVFGGLYMAVGWFVLRTQLAALLRQSGELFADGQGQRA